MDSTSVSLLKRLRRPEQNAAWQRFVDLYAPLIFHWAKNQGLNATDASDLVQEVLAVLVTKLPQFEYDQNQRFRGWLRTISVNKARDFHRRNTVRPNTGKEEVIANVAVTDTADLFDEEEYRNFLVRRLRQLMEAEFEPKTWQACWKHVTEGRSAADVGQELGISANAVRVAKCRVLCRLREELDGLIDWFLNFPEMIRPPVA
jgi:RNA polymerase sigma-70 factor, ECF subfamily